MAILTAECPHCKFISREIVKPLPGNYEGTILKSYWCERCDKPIVIRYKIEGEEGVVTEIIENAKIFEPRKPEAGITIRPRTK